MTGFSRAQGSDECCDWNWEIRSVNGRILDLRCRLGLGGERFESEVKKRIGARFKRGNISVTLKLSYPSVIHNLQVNQNFLNHLISLWRDYEGKNKIQPPTFDGLLSLRGVIETVSEDESSEEFANRDLQILKTLDEALDSMSAMRIAEGNAIQKLLLEQLNELSSLTIAVEKILESHPKNAWNNLKQQIEKLIDDKSIIDNDRIAQEVAILVSKSDIREELDRLQAHLEAAREQIIKGGAMGRKLDFISQEFNREANTLCAKANNYKISELGLSMKLLIDQFKEQIQNLE